MKRRNRQGLVPLTKPNTVRNAISKDVETQIRTGLLRVLERYDSTTQILSGKITVPEFPAVLASNAAIEHARAALEAMPNYPIQAIILLRSAYESTILAKDLTLFPNNLSAFRLYSDLVALRNQYTVLKYVPDQSAYDEQSGYIMNKVSSILREYENKGLTPPIIDSLERLEEKTEKPQWEPFYKIRERVEKAEGYSPEERISFQAYNIGSQVAHANRDSMISHYALGREQPLYPDRSIYREIIHMISENLKLLKQRDILDVGSSRITLLLSLYTLIRKIPL